MVGSLAGMWMLGLLAAAPAGDFTFEGHKAEARTTSPVGFFAQGATPYPNLFERGLGSASLTAEDRITAPGATYGDKAQVEAELRLGELRYRVELTQPGFAPPQVSGAAAARPAAPRPGYPVEGGVILDRDLNGSSGLGWPATTRVHAAVAVWGLGSVWRNGQLLTDSAVIEVAALSHGAQADDDTHTTLPVAREGDTELHVLAWNLPLSAEPRGFIQFSFDDVGISLDRQQVKSVAVLPNVMGVDSIGPMAVFGGVGAGGTFAPASPQPPSGVGGSGFDATAAPVTGTPGGPVTPVSPGTIGGPAAGTLASGPGVGIGAVMPDTTSGTFPTVGAPNPAANISGLIPGTPAPGSALAAQSPVPPGAPAPGAPAESGVALGSTPPTLSTAGTFTVPISPSNFSTLSGTGQVSPGLIATVPPMGTDRTIPTPPLLGSPAPLTAAPATPLLGTPAPLNAAPAPALIGTPAPAGAVPGAATPAIPGVAPVPAAGATGVPPSI
jgi:hypothetical protein